MKAFAAMAAVLGVVLLAIGLVLGLGSVNRSGVNCGSALGGKTNAAEVHDLTAVMEGGPVSSAAENACSSALSDRHTLALALLIPGGLLLVLGAIGGVATYHPEHDRTVLPPR